MALALPIDCGRSPSGPAAIVIEVPAGIEGTVLAAKLGPGGSRLGAGHMRNNDKKNSKPHRCARRQQSADAADADRHEPGKTG